VCITRGQAAKLPSHLRCQHLTQHTNPRSTLPVPTMHVYVLVERHVDLFRAHSMSSRGQGRLRVMCVVEGHPCRATRCAPTGIVLHRVVRICDMKTLKKL
jgi:hypothetical protein